MSLQDSQSSFFYRVFAGVERKIWLAEIEKFLDEEGVALTALGIVDEEDEDNLDATPEAILFVDDENREVATLEYDRRDESELLREEIDEFLELVDEMLPECNRAWTRDKLAASVGCFAFEMAEAGLEEENWDSVAAIAAWLRDETNGVEESDGGQFTNESGSVVLVVPDDEEEDSEDSDWYNCPVAIRKGDAWVEKEVDSKKAFDEFLRGDA